MKLGGQGNVERCHQKAFRRNEESLPVRAILSSVEEIMSQERSIVKNNLGQKKTSRLSKRRSFLLWRVKSVSDRKGTDPRGVFGGLRLYSQIVPVYYQCLVNI